MTCLQAVGEDGGHTEVAKVMDTWTKQIGYPVITINTTSGEIYQKHFLFNDSSESRFVLKAQLMFYCRFRDSEKIIQSSVSKMEITS